MIVRTMTSLNGLYQNLLEGIRESIAADSVAASCDRVMTYFLLLSQAEHGSLFLVKKGQFHRVYSTLSKDKWITPSKRGISYQVYKTQSPALLTESKLKTTHPDHIEQGIRMMYIIPIISKNKTIGVISLHFNKNKKMEPSLDAVLREFGKIAGATISNKIRLASLQKQLKNKELSAALTAHELKTPLTTISTYAQLVARQFSQGKQITKQWLSLLVDETKRASNIVNEYMEESDKKKDTGTCDLHDLIERAVVNFSVSYPSHSLRVVNTLANEATVTADPDKLLQVLTNILNNAAKFSPVNRTIFLQAETTKNNHLLSIRDQGRGMKTDELSLVFKRWYKGDKSSEGRGLGLYIAKNILEQYRGAIEVTSQYGHGTTMTIKLPKASF